MQLEGVGGAIINPAVDLGKECHVVSLEIVIEYRGGQSPPSDISPPWVSAPSLTLSKQAPLMTKQAYRNSKNK